MELPHKGKNHSVTFSFDYDLISLSNTLAYSLEEGLDLAASMLNAPFLITSLNDYVIIRSEPVSVNDPDWRSIVETRFCDPAVAAANKNIHSVMVPAAGKLVFYSDDEPTARQRQLASYIAWMVFQFAQERFYVPGSDNTPKSAVFFHLLNERLDAADQSLPQLFFSGKSHQKLQILATFLSTAADSCAADIAKICSRTEYVVAHKQRYRLFLFPQLVPEREEDLGALLARNKLYAGLSYPFKNCKECHKYVSQATAALNEAANQKRKTHLAQYEELFASDVLHNYSSNVPLSSFRHPLFLYLEEYDRNNRTEFYLTLMAYLENSGNTSKTAKQLSLHRNTVSYRLRQITELTSYDAQSSSARAALLYAMTVERTLKKTAGNH